MKDSEAEKWHSEVEKISRKWKGMIALLFVQQLADLQEYHLCNQYEP